MRRITFICLAVMLTFPLFSQERRHAFDMNERLGKGINLGDTFEAPSEEAWGNPWNPGCFKMIAGLGFTHIRVPIRWEPADRSMNTPPYTIYPEFMERIKSVVDEALKNKLHIIINMHHHEALIAGQAGQQERFLSQWSQISTYFKDYPDSLLFELLNEPHDQITSALWNGLVSDALAGIRKTNADRIVLIGAAEWGGIEGLSQLQLPGDEHIILTVHYYSPFNFTHQGAEFAGMQGVTGVKWDDTELDRETIQQEFKAVIRFSETNKVPVHIGEFGTFYKADMDSRVRWTTYLSRWFEEQGFSWAYWEFSSTFGIYNPITQTFVQPLVDALLYNPIPDPIPVIVTPVYKSNFRNGTDGWYLNNIEGTGASSTYSVRDNKLEITIANGGTEVWHVQIIKPFLTLEKGQMYRISFTTNASTACYLGSLDYPYTRHSDLYPLISTGPEEQSIWYVFTMDGETDSNVRCVFELGQVAGMKSVAGTYTFSNIQIDKLDFNTTGVATIKQEKNLPLYLTQDQNRLCFLNEDDYLQISIFSLDGKLLAKHPLTAGLNEINTVRWPSGIYIVMVDGKGKNAVRKIWKKF